MNALPARLALALLVTAVAAAAFPAGAGARAPEPYVAVQGFDEPATPARYDRVYVRKFGPASARRVLVLVPGFIAGSGNFTLVARELVRRVPGLAVWAVDRRSNPLEDTSRFRPGTSLAEAFDYYGGLRFRQVDGARDTPFARRWGLRVAVEDLRRVILAARRGGRRVTLGGHSLGGSTTAAYAAWDFNGRPGHRDVDGLLMIDGGLLGTFTTATLADARRRKGEVDRGDPFESLLPGLPVWAAGVLAEVGAMFARREPDARSALQDYPLLPPAFKPPVPVTNEAMLGHAFDATTSPPGFELLRVRAGGLAPTGDPRPWADGERTPVQNIAQLLFQEPGNAVEWYFPKRLRLDVDGASLLARNSVARFLGLRPWHLASVDDPVYAYQTDLTRGRVLRGARAFVRRSDVRSAVYVDDPNASHNDALWGAPARNRFLRTVVPFLRRLG